MSYAARAHGGLEYYPYRLTRSRVQFRGPRKRMEGTYIACLGGTETYGRFVEAPFPDLLERELRRSCLNFGTVNAGLDLYLNEPAVMQAAQGAAVAVFQVLGAQNMSNRYYSVHPRRNDRFLRASPLLQSVYPEVDFTEFHFNRHMLGRLQEICEDRYMAVVGELREAWLARMKHILSQMRGDTVLMWAAEHAPPESREAALHADPLFVDREMVESLRPRVSAVVEIVASEAARRGRTEGMIYSDFEASAAAGTPGPTAHEEIADALLPVLRPMIESAAN